MSKSDSEIDENSDVAPDRRNGDQNDQEILQNPELLPATDHAVVDSGRPPSEPQGTAMLAMENNSQHGHTQIGATVRESSNENDMGPGFVVIQNSGTGSATSGHERSGSARSGSEQSDR
jgi:hypothetical protein